MRDALTDIVSVYEAIRGEALPGTGAERRGYCLVHDDKNPSCDYNTVKDAWICRSCEANGGVLDLVVQTGRAKDRHHAVLWLAENGPEARPVEQKAAQVAQKPFDWSVATIYRYQNANGILAYEVGRSVSKDFRQRVPHGSAWKYSLDGVTRVPYRLPELLEGINAGRMVFFVEGEKDADRLIACGRLATTNAQGAKWDLTSDFTDYFKAAKTIVVLGDNDEPGRKAARKRADALAAVCKDVRLIEALPGVGEHGDISDWLDAGHNIEELKPLIDAAPKADAFGIVWQPDIIARGVQPVKWDIEMLIESNNGPTLLTAPPESFKSWFAMFVAASMVTGKPLFGAFSVCNRRPFAFYINLDAGKTATENRVAKLGPQPIPNFGVMSWDAWDFERFEKLLKAHPGAFVVIDCFANTFMMGESRMETAEAMRSFLQPLRQVYERYGCNGIIIDHTPRDDGKRKDPGELFYGSQQKKATIRQGITLVKPPPEEPDSEADAASNEAGANFGKKWLPSMRNVIEVHCLKMSEAEKFMPFEIEFKPEGQYVTCAVIGKVSGKKAKARDRDKDTLRKVLAQASEPLTRVQLESITGLSRERIHRAISDPRLFEVVGKGKNTAYKAKPGSDEF